MSTPKANYYVSFTRERAGVKLACAISAGSVPTKRNADFRNGTKWHPREPHLEFLDGGGPKLSGRLPHVCDSVAVDAAEKQRHEQGGCAGIRTRKIRGRSRGMEEAE